MESLLDEIARYQLTSYYPFEPIPAIQEAIMMFEYSPELHGVTEEGQVWLILPFTKTINFSNPFFFPYSIRMNPLSTDKV